MKRLSLFLAACAWASVGQAQIKIAERFALGDPIVAMVEVADLKGAALDWRAQQIVQLSDGTEVLGLAEAGCIPVDGGKSVHVWGKPAKYQLELTLATVADGTPSIKRHKATFTVDGGAPVPVPPGPVPPGPVPPVPPDPTPTPVVEGKRQVVIIRESAEMTPNFAVVLTNLRAGPEAAYLKDRGHTLTILDDDDLPPNLKAKLGALPALPAVFIIDVATGVVVKAEPVGAKTASQITELIRQTGG